MDDCPRCGATRSDDPGWCGLCFTPHVDAKGPAEDQVLVMVTGSSSGDGELTFPAWMRVLMSLAVLGGGVLLFEGFEPWWNVGRPVWALGLVLLIVYGTLGGILVSRLWAPATFGRREEHIVVLDPAKIREVEERHRALVAEPASTTG